MQKSISNVWNEYGSILNGELKRKKIKNLQVSTKIELKDKLIEQPCFLYEIRIASHFSNELFLVP